MTERPVSDVMIPPRGRFHLIQEQTVVLAASRVTFPGLDINTDRMYYLEADFRNAIAANTRFHAYVENNLVLARYWRQRAYAAGAGMSAQRVNESRVLEVTANQPGKLSMYFHRSIAGRPYMEGRSMGRQGANIHMSIFYVQCLDIYPNITSITLMARNGLGVEVVGFLPLSRFRLYVVGG